MKPRQEHQVINGIECKYCTKCKTFVDISNYAKNKNTWDGLYCYCFNCKRKSAKVYYVENSDFIIDKATHYAINNREKYLEYQKEYQQTNKDKILQTHKIWIDNNKDYMKEYNKLYKRERRKETEYRILANLRNRLCSAAKGNKSQKTINLIGCDIPTLKSYLEKSFQPEMTWDNYGKWHIDHIIPCASFDLSKEEEQRKCFNYTNLQPLWAIDNIKKGAKKTI